MTARISVPHEGDTHMHRRTRKLFLFALVFSGLSTIGARADAVTDWIKIMLQANHTAAVTPVTASRNGAIVESSVFDAVNAVTGLYSTIHIAPAAPRGTPAPAAAVQAASVTLLHVYPPHAATLTPAPTH